MSFLRRFAVLGYPFLLRVLPAALAALAQSAAVRAGSIAGTVIFPSQLVPSMTVYAAELDTSRVHKVQLARGQANFAVEVPPGRYLVFLAPNEPGAPNIYGAYTRFSLCASHDPDQCTDHALVPVTITAKALRTAVSIDDWYLTDDIAEQIDHILGAADGGVRVASEPLGAPRFSEYPSESFDPSGTPKIDFDSSELPEEDREMVRQALSSGPNFAGSLTVTLTSCGPACGRLVLVDWHTGQVQEPALAEIQGTLPCRADEALLFRRDSRLLSVTRARGTAVVTQYFVWNQKNAALVQSGEYQRTSAAFCAVAAR